MTILHSQNMCISISSKVLQKEHIAEFFKPKVKSFLFRLSVLFKNLYRKDLKYESVVAI